MPIACTPGHNVKIRSIGMGRWHPLVHTVPRAAGAGAGSTYSASPEYDCCRLYGEPEAARGVMEGLTHDSCCQVWLQQIKSERKEAKVNYVSARVLGKLGPVPAAQLERATTTVRNAQKL